ncbi:choline/glycine/proline betaine transport protein [Halopolyspora algeriensis]|uniref:Choline/glycine/proline betaine transport protein n=1 Tax=Halopolyspora algeriensis TaxID=1500506 RepID=A0A368VFY3_9ACTN|nr:choline BCCT transporter BetT [Halopolyspora algeriensis]RCW39553.1 choline/glycine/proline betaine transport protein [Halopolyspora algeriensis]TQM56134.1 choline/glycine/proline betaine transport protein [Halopolyspora algeriensis]
MSDDTPTGLAAESTQQTRLNRIVFYGSAVVILAIALWAVVTPAAAAEVIGTVVSWISTWFGWFYILLTTIILVFVVFLGVSRYGRTKLGPQHSQPEFSTLTWASMLFAAGIGTDVMFFAVSEPVTQYLSPPHGQGETIEAARQATVWMLFHYGISGWGMYALMGIALAFFAYRRGLPLAIRSALYPIFGKRIYGGLGHGVDLAAVLGTIFGIAASLGIGVVLLSYGLEFLFGIPTGTASQIGLVAVAVIMATLSAVSGVDKGIKRLSQLNVLLALGLAGFILVTGKTVFLLNALVLNLGVYVRSFPGMTLETFAFDRPVDWLNAWTLFFWAWWIAWASFVGLFLARISRGRTIRQFVTGTLIIPFLYILMWGSIFGNTALDIVRTGGGDFGQVAVNQPAQGFYSLLAQFPATLVIAGLATFVGLLFYVTSADSGALVMANLTSHLPTPEADARSGVRIFWAMATGLLTMAMLIVGGVPALQNATIIMGLPFAFVMILVMVGLYKALRMEGTRADSQRQSLPTMLSGRSTTAEEGAAERTWRNRLTRALTFPDRVRIDEFLTRVAEPALDTVAQEMHAQGVQAHARRETDHAGVSYLELVADIGEEHPFRYQIRPHEATMPAYGSRGSEVYYRLEVHLQEGGQGYDVMGYTHGQLIDDVLDQYEAHLEFLRLNETTAG